jgi:thiamine biosynthesis lipoprotein ApbE
LTTTHFFCCFAESNSTHSFSAFSDFSAAGTLSATVITKNAETADALATGCYVMGLEQVQQFHQEHPEHGIIMVTPGKRAGQNELHTFGMDDRKWQVLMDKI